MKNSKNVLSGITVAFITLLYWFFIMTYGDLFRRAHHAYWKEITFGFIISTIILNLCLIFVFYRRLNIKSSKNLCLIALPYIILLVITEIVSQNIPRSLDIIFIVLGSCLIYSITKRELAGYKPVVVLGIYLTGMLLSYTYLFNMIESMTLN